MAIERDGFTVPAPHPAVAGTELDYHLNQAATWPG